MAAALRRAVTAAAGAAAAATAAHTSPGHQAAAAAAATACWSAAIGNTQLPWAAGCQQLSSLQQRSAWSSDAAAASSDTPGSSSGVPQPGAGSPTQAPQERHPHAAAAAASRSSVLAAAVRALAGDAPPGAAAAAPLSAAALNFDDTPAGPGVQPPAASDWLAGGGGDDGPAAASSVVWAGAAAPRSLPTAAAQPASTAAAAASASASDGSAFLIPAGISLDNAAAALPDLLKAAISHYTLGQLQPFQLAPSPSLQQLQQQEALTVQGLKGFRVQNEAFGMLNTCLARLAKSKGSREAARAASIPKTLLPQAMGSFRRFMLRGVTPGLLATLLVAGARPNTGALSQQEEGDTAAAAPAAAPRVSEYNAAVEALLLPLFVEFCKEHHSQEIAAYAAAVAALDLRSPHTWYPYARAIKRKIVYHGGPTNSGKTYNALQSLAAARRGVYCAPLRLLAMEVYETLNHRGVHCNLVTGQEVMKVPGSSHVACTVEMAAINTHADVAVIDEVQLMGDEQRGFAWTRALLGVPANTVHVCGDTSAVQLVRHLAALCGDDFEMHTYERMTPLKVDTVGLPRGWADVQAGDAVVAFSRRSIYKARRAIEVATGHKTCIVYGALPAETRRHQARLFNNPASGVNVLIASDAIGLGLNFNIRRVIFTTLTKRAWGGRVGQSRVPVSLVKQIAGRAGRRGSIYPEGCAATLDPKDLPYLKHALEAPASALYTPAAGLTPEYETVELLSAQFPALSLEELLRKLDTEARLDGRYFLCRQEQMLHAARALRKVPTLSLQDQFTLVNAPIDVYDERQRAAYMAFASTYASGQPVLFNEALMPAGPPQSETQMAEAENLHKIMGCWLWLSFRFEEGSFPGRERVQALTRTLCHWLNLGLASIQVTAAQAAAEAAEGADAEEDTADVSSSDADEINEACFTTPVAEASPSAGDAAGCDGEQQPAGQDAASSGAGPGGVTPTSVQLDELLRRVEQEERRRRHDPYVRWTGAVASGVAAASSSSTTTTSSSSSAMGLHQQVAPEAVGLPDGLDGSLSGEALQQLLMPEFEASMAPYVRWVSRPRFRPPPPPQAVVVGGRRREAA